MPGTREHASPWHAAYAGLGFETAELEGSAAVRAAVAAALERCVNATGPRECTCASPRN